MKNTTMKKYARKCSATGKGMNKGYCFGDGEKYFKREKDLVKYLREDNEGSENLTDEFILNESYENDEYYWTEWTYIEEGENYYDKDGNEYTPDGIKIEQDETNN